MKNLLIAPLFCFGIVACAPTTLQNFAGQDGVSSKLSFFVTSVGKGDGANLGGLEGADAHCETLASTVGQGGKGWRAYLSTTGVGGANARDRIGSGPWINAKGVQIAADLTELHGDNNIANETAISESGADVPGRDTEAGWRPYHDMFTGTQSDGTALNSQEDTTCSNWTSNSEGSALLGHHNREGGGYDATSWVNAHASNACAPEGPESSSAGLFYCFASQDK